MKKALLLLALLVGTASIGIELLNACGAKFLVSSRGTRYQRVLANITPTNILIYWAQDENTDQEERLHPDVVTTLEDAGHTVTLAFNTEQFRSALDRDKFDVVLMPLADALELGGDVLSSSPGSALLPVLYLPTRRQLSDAKKNFGNALRYPTTVTKLLSEVEQSRQTAVKNKTRIAHRS